ncbi:putative phiE125 gp8 family phage protein [Agrobacterium vitis]|nr:putative phiE125 gp8 family phage protein [Agrobacterium vitis]MBE1439204.1 putative phiE125 gp8 family phage protein [Agrobacterium vitis]
MTITTLTPPTVEPLALTDVKAHLKIDTNDEDDLLTSLITTARQHLEAETGLCLMTQKLRLYLDDWPDGEVIQLAKAPVQTIDAVTVYDENGNAVQASLHDHLLDGQARPARLWLRNPPLPGRPINGIEIDFTAGYSTATDVPDTLRRAMSLHVATMYAYRGVVAPGDQPAALPLGYERLIAPFCRRRL